jgi:glucose/arabinose dehydrogenase
MWATMPPMAGHARPAGLLLVSILAAGCGADPASTQPAASAGATSATVEASPSPSEAAAPTPTPTPVAGDPPPLALEIVADGLAEPIGILGAPGGWLLVSEQAGRVIAVHPDTGDRATVVELGDRIRSGGEQGLLGLVLHPDWPSVPRAWVHYTASDGMAVLSELAGTQDGEAAPVLDPASERVLLRIPDPYPNHNGGQLAFGPDGHLWMGIGDGGAGDDPHGHGQDVTTLLGSILRLDVSQPGAYAIPADNPFADGGGAPEIYLVGLRNPWRFSFDPATGLLWIGDVGQNAYEEIDRLDPATSSGANLGWNVMEAAHCFISPDCAADGLVLPLAEYGRDRGCSLTGGAVYRGAAIEGLEGWYLAADYCTGYLFGVPSDAQAPDDGTALSPQVLLETNLSVSSFGVGIDGELYLADHGGGTVTRLVAGG